MARKSRETGELFSRKSSLDDDGCKVPASTIEQGARGSQEKTGRWFSSACPEAGLRAGYFATWRSRSSSSVLQSMHSVAVGRASRRLRPISTPQLSQ